MATTTADERAVLMPEHMKAMQQAMVMMPGAAEKSDFLPSTHPPIKRPKHRVLGAHAMRVAWLSWALSQGTSLSTFERNMCWLKSRPTLSLL
ncbi:hypothetical protein [Rhodoferax sp.]|uniref:hypothetical protein n=1 Tax=Rhodoferax sp. TaxID=50421 RepID=UPI0026248F6F|nr:hypothetical protein [Rhodoferax sp.]MDD3935589.1 hypothetical protein [Rhodoferax sp.]